MAAMSREVTVRRRRETILALAATGLTQNTIAAKLKLSRKTVNRYIQESKPSLSQAQDLLDHIASSLAKLQTPDKIARNYVSMAERSKMDSIKLAAQDKILEYRGVITERERFKKDRDLSAGQTALFVLPEHVNLSFTLNTTTSTDIETKVIDVSANDITHKKE
jgi:predicted transcriptional regulator